MLTRKVNRMQNADTQSFQIDARLAAEAHGNFVPMLIVNVAASAAATWVMAPTQMMWVSIWFAFVVLLTPLRFLGWWRFRSALQDAEARSDSGPSEASVRNWLLSYRLGLYTAGASWALINFFGIQFADDHAKYTIIIIMSGLAGGATAVTAPQKTAGQIYISLLLLPGSLSLIFVDQSEPLLVALGLLFLAVMLVIQGNNHAMILRGVSLQNENQVLVADLRSLNAGLETKVAERTEALRQIAHRDNLTGLPNRRGLMEWVSQNFDANDEFEGAIMFLDLDRFKQINDAMGHDVGDKVLEVAAFRLRQNLPENAILARWGGDEFIIALEQGKNVRKTVSELSQMLLDSLMLPVEVQGQSLGVGVSVGVAYFPTDSSRCEDVIQAADLAMAEVKKTERGRALEFSNTYAETQRRRFDLSRALGAAIESNSLMLHYQPIIDTATGKVASLEALCRWRHPELGPISPEEFIPLAEDSDRIVALGDWVLRKACSDAVSWDDDINVAVNVSVRQLLSVDFTRRISRILKRAGLEPSRLELEVTESLFDEENTDVMLGVVQQLRQRGVAVHIDDFGTGYSSLSRLLEFPVTAIKIDKSFVARMHEQGAVIIESALMIAQRFNFKVVAEGVETREQAQQLAAMGVDYIQGYAYGRPNEKPMLTGVDPEWLSDEAPLAKIAG